MRIIFSQKIVCYKQEIHITEKVSLPVDPRMFQVCRSEFTEWT